ncbi:hypothetical protein RRG08_022589 [Elysia crispata]|uniref:Uncharacterized protein n=1 Tax=Elysia crispata TaxID=231223 RepID=A0AAE1D8A6_9GAST|nr:hypothetical protein RRG08_022589 [Elysia crispata]
MLASLNFKKDILVIILSIQFIYSVNPYFKNYVKLAVPIIVTTNDIVRPVIRFHRPPRKTRPKFQKWHQVYTRSTPGLHQVYTRSEPGLQTTDLRYPEPHLTEGQPVKTCRTPKCCKNRYIRIAERGA